MPWPETQAFRRTSTSYSIGRFAWDGGGRRYDMVVVNAGRGLAGGILDSDESQWQELYQVNVMGAAHLMRRAGQYLVGRKSGDIVVVGSVVGRNVSPFSGFYGSSKFAIGAIAEGLRREVCPHGVRVSLVMPGVVLSEFQHVAGYDEGKLFSRDCPVRQTARTSGDRGRYPLAAHAAAPCQRE